MPPNWTCSSDFTARMFAFSPLPLSPLLRDSWVTQLTPRSPSNLSNGQLFPQAENSGTCLDADFLPAFRGEPRATPTDQVCGSMSAPTVGQAGTLCSVNIYTWGFWVCRGNLLCIRSNHTQLQFGVPGN